MGGFLSRFTSGNGQVTEVVNIGITNKGHLFPFNTTTTLKKLPKRPKKWFNASEYFASTVGLNTGYMVTIDHTQYRVMRMDRKRGKVWVGIFAQPKQPKQEDNHGDSK